jgi:hypothetical protein
MREAAAGAPRRLQTGTRVRRRIPYLLAAAGLALAGTSGYLASTALSAGQQQQVRTVTINVATGPRGPAGAPGPAGPQGERGPVGPAGGIVCADGYTAGDLRINHPGGQVTIRTCVKN